MRSSVQSVRGRSLAALGRLVEAATVFEQASTEAHDAGLWLNEALLLRDSKVRVLDKLGHGEHASRRLGAALRLLSATADKLTSTLLADVGPDLDAKELMALPPPDSSYHVVHDV